MPDSLKHYEHIFRKRLNELKTKDMIHPPRVEPPIYYSYRSGNPECKDCNLYIAECEKLRNKMAGLEKDSEDLIRVTDELVDQEIKVADLTNKLKRYEGHSHYALVSRNPNGEFESLGTIIIVFGIPSFVFFTCKENWIMGIIMAAIIILTSAVCYTVKTIRPK